MSTAVFVAMIDTGCSICDLPFAVPRTFWNRGQEQSGAIWCPAGHRMTFGESANERLQRQLTAVQGNLKWEQERAECNRKAAEAERRHHAATKGQLTKAKRRAANGVCPCCNRSFVNVARHVAGQHPEFVAATAAPAMPGQEGGEG